MNAFVDHVQYNELSSLGEVAFISHNQNVIDIINGPIRDAFLKHAVHNAFCLYLQHHHHAIAAQETVVKVNGTAHLMHNEDIKDITSCDNKVLPTTWMTTGDKLLPMECTVLPNDETYPEPSSAFVADFLTVLAVNGCTGLFCIDTLASSNWSEIKIGDASVVVPSNDEERHDNDEFIPVAFAFDEKTPDFKVHGRCVVEHKHTTKPG